MWVGVHGDEMESVTAFTEGIERLVDGRKRPLVGGDFAGPTRPTAVPPPGRAGSLGVTVETTYPDGSTAPSGPSALPDYDYPEEARAQDLGVAKCRVPVRITAAGRVRMSGPVGECHEAFHPTVQEVVKQLQWPATRTARDSTVVLRFDPEV